MANAVTFWKGTRAKYDSLPADQILNTRIYFCEDTGEIFKGAVRFSKEILTDYDNTEGVSEKVAMTYLPNIMFQGKEVSAGIGQTINFIGIGNVSADDNGNITVRLGENLNCSLWNGTDGISTATVSSAKSGDATATVSSDYSDVSAAGSKQIFYGDDNITAKAGSTASTAAGATSGNGNSVHFDNNTNGYFLVNILEGKNTTATTYRVGPITASGTYTGKIGETSYAGISCAVASFGEEPKKANGATGYAGTVNFTFKPANMGWESQDFKLVSIEQVNIDADGKVSNVATWTNSTTNGSYFYLKETGDSYKAGSPATASIAFNDVSSAVKTISGVTYITTSSTFKVSATGLKNLGYPANSGTKVTVSASGGTWMTGYSESDTAKFTTWTTAKDVEMSYTSGDKNPLIGKWDNPEVTVNGNNLIGAGAAPVTTATDIKLLVCDSNGYITTGHGSFASLGDTLADDSLMVYDGCLVYPSMDFSGYNIGLPGIGITAQPNYSSEATERSYTKTFTLTGTKTGGSITLTHKATAASDTIKKALAAGTIKVEVKAKGGEWRDASEQGIGQASSTYSTTSTKLDFVFAFDTDYPNATTGTAVRITMSSAVADIKNITLA